MSDVARQYRAGDMLSAEPSMEWVIRGIRGVMTFVGHAMIACKNGNTGAKITAVKKASDLLMFMQCLVPKGTAENPLGDRLDALYTSWQVALTNAHAANDAVGFAALRRELGQLANELTVLSGGNP